VFAPFLPYTFQRREKRRGIAKCIEGVRHMAFLSFLDRERSVAHAGYSRWLVPPAALAIHLSIGQVYAFSVFKIPLTQLLGIGKSMPDDWMQTQIAWIFSLAIVMLGLSARFFSSSVCDLRPLPIHRIGISLVEIQPILRKVVNFEQTSVFW
jgi:hypothetical protein